MVPWYIALLALLAGALVTSIVEYKLNYNLVDKILDLFRSLEAKAAADKRKLEALTARMRARAAADIQKIKSKF
jgi:cytochrome c biogenesis protein ResB